MKATEDTERTEKIKDSEPLTLLGVLLALGG
jgi:hypothetical protein